jgi:hypothetical protein
MMDDNRIINEVANWRNIPAKGWNYYFGCYQVIKKWLSYREKPLLGRRLAAIVFMELALNKNYQKVKVSTYPWLRPTN